MEDTESDSQLPLLSRENAIKAHLSIKLDCDSRSSLFDFAIVFSFIKMIASIVLSLCLSDYWKSCSATATNENYLCTASGDYMACTTENGCFLTDSTTVGEQCRDRCFFGVYSVVGVDASGCYGYVDKNCLCYFWSSTTLIVICLNIIHFAIQLAYYYFGYDFNPQTIPFKIAAYGSSKDVYVLLFLPRNCLLSCVEVLTVMFAWFPLVYGSSELQSSITCDDNGLRSQTAVITTYYQPVLYGLFITLMELYKANLQCMFDFNLYDNIFIDKLIGLTYLLRFDIAACYGFIQLVQSLVFGLSLVFLGFPLIHIQSGYIELRDAYESTQVQSPGPPGAESGGGGSRDQRVYRQHWRVLGYNLGVFVCLVFGLIIIIAVR